MDDDFYETTIERGWETAEQMLAGYLDNDRDKVREVLNGFATTYGVMGVFTVVTALFYMGTCGGRVASVLIGLVDKDGEFVGEADVDDAPPKFRLMFWMLRGLSHGGNEGGYDNAIAAWRAMPHMDQVECVEQMVMLAAEHARRHPTHSVAYEPWNATLYGPGGA